MYLCDSGESRDLPSSCCIRAFPRLACSSFTPFSTAFLSARWFPVCPPSKEVREIDLRNRGRSVVSLSILVLSGLTSSCSEYRPLSCLLWVSNVLLSSSRLCFVRSVVERLASALPVGLAPTHRKGTLKDTITATERDYIPARTFRFGAFPSLESDLSQDELSVLRSVRVDRFLLGEGGESCCEAWPLSSSVFNSRISSFFSNICVRLLRVSISWCIRPISSS